jgi:NAD(P)-dependent dehydrogenase (short-subunit alcohol dehydrogenase family)
MDTGLKGKKALVTGSTSGLGYGIAEALIQEGARVIINSDTEKNVKAAVKRLQEKYPSASIRGITADLTKLEDGKTYADAVKAGS